MPIEPGPCLGVLVRTVIVQDHVDDLARRNLGLDGIEEADELLMPVALHAAGGPVGRFAGRIGLRQRDHPLSDFRSQRLDARRSGLVVQEPCDTLLHEALLPAPDAILALAAAACDLDRAEAGGGQQDNSCPPYVLLRAVPSRDDRFQTSTIGGHHPDNRILAHPPDFAFQQRQGNPSRFCDPCGMANMLCGPIIDGLAMEPPGWTRSGASRRSTVSVAVAQALPKMQVSARFVPSLPQ